MSRSPVFTVSSGTRQVVHHGEAALYLAEPAPGLVAAFTSASGSSDAVDAVTEAAERADLAVPAFAAVHWRAGAVRIAVFGAVTVTSDHRSLPRLSAAGSATWVERTVHTGSITLSVDEEFTIALGHPSALTEPATGEAGAPTAAVPGTTPPPRPETAAHTPAGAAPAAAASRPPGGPAETPPARSAGARPAADEAPTLDVPDTGWLLRFEDGPIEPVDRPLVIGRRPATDPADPDEAAARLVQLDCPQMSARHLAVRADAAGLWITDLHSRNRAWVLTSGDHRLVALEPGVPTLVEHGTHVQIGTKVFVVEQLAEPPLTEFTDAPRGGLDALPDGD